MEISGYDLGEIIDDGLESYGPQKAGRVAHIDGDFLAYQVTFDEERKWEDIVHNIEVSLETTRLLCNAEKYEIHLTGNGSTKGGRYEQAMLKPYQDARKDKKKPSRLEGARMYMRDQLGAHYWMDREADDGMAAAQQEAILNGNRDLSVIVSADKDLRIVQGLHLCPDTHDIVDVNGYGSLFMKEMKSGKKLLGWGPAFFFAQLLMGDPADGVSGLPAQVITIDGDKPKHKLKKIGAVGAYEILRDVQDVCTAYNKVYAMYCMYGVCEGFNNYRDGSHITAREALTSECRLLWMRTRDCIDDWKQVARLADGKPWKD